VTLNTIAVPLDKPSTTPAGGVHRHRRDESRPGSVAEEYGRRPVLLVDDARDRLRTHHQHMLMHSGRHQTGSRSKRVDEPGAPGGDVEGTGIEATQFEGDARSRRRHDLVGRDGGRDDQVDLIGGNSSVRQSRPTCKDTEVRGAEPRVGHTPRADACPLRDPLIGGVEDCSKVVVRDHEVGQVRT
jgi:hypothetical protein